MAGEDSGGNNDNDGINLEKCEREEEEMPSLGSRVSGVFLFHFLPIIFAIVKPNNINIYSASSI